MADQGQQAEPQETDPKQQPQEPQGDQKEPQGTDWKAEARKWEERAKANKAKADKWDEQEAQAPTVESLKQRLDEMERESQRAKDEAARTAALMQVSQETGVPASLIHGGTEQEMRESAQAVSDYAKQLSPGYPSDKGGSNPGGSGITREQIEQVKDPIARVRMIADNRNLFQ